MSNVDNMDCKDIGIRKSEFVTKTQSLYKQKTKYNLIKVISSEFLCTILSKYYLQDRFLVILAGSLIFKISTKL